MKIECPSCKTEYEVEDSSLGRKVECPCGTSWIVKDAKKIPDPPPPTKKGTQPPQISAAEASAIAKKKRAEAALKHELICPSCLGTNLHTDSKGFSVKKAAVGLILVGPVGLIGGAIGSKDVQFTCLGCGRKFTLAELHEFQAQQEKIASMEISEIVDRDKIGNIFATVIVSIILLCIVVFIIALFCN